MKLLRYVELKSGYADNGPAWISLVTPSKSGRTLYFNGRALLKFKGADHDCNGGNYCDRETGESYWVSGVKKNGRDRHRAGTGKVLIEEAAVPEYLETVGAGAINKLRLTVTRSIVPIDIKNCDRIANTSYRSGNPDE